MTYSTAIERSPTGAGASIALIIEPGKRNLGGVSVRRVLPSNRRRMVGPFILFDHFGPAEFAPGHGIRMRPQPHIGLAAVTFLFEGEILHRDSLGFCQSIRAGAVNLMTAGSGIVHSERAGEEFETVSRLHGIQSWIALPANQEDCKPAFSHFPAHALPELCIEGVTVRVIIGSAYGRTSPVTHYSPSLYLDYRLPERAEIALPDSWRELAVYVVAGEVQIDQQIYGVGTMAIASPGWPVRLVARKESHVMIIGGEPVGQRHIWWNFVSSSKGRIDQAKADWQEQRFDAVPGETEFVPLAGEESECWT